MLAALLPTVVAAQTAENAFAQWGDLAVLGDNAPHYFDLGLGVFDLRESFGTSERSAAGRVELRGGRKLWFLGPAMGLMVNTDGGVFGYGGVFQFRLSLGISYVFPNRHRIGLNFAHISNAAIHDKNPGEEELYITYAIPF